MQISWAKIYVNIYYFYWESEHSSQQIYFFIVCSVVSQDFGTSFIFRDHLLHVFIINVFIGCYLEMWLSALGPAIRWSH